MVTCSKIIRTEIRIHPIPIHGCVCIAAKDIVAFYQFKLRIVKIEIPMICNVIIRSIRICFCCSHPNANGCILFKTKDCGKLRTLPDCRYTSTIVSRFTACFFLTRRFNTELSGFQTKRIRNVLTGERLLRIQRFKIFYNIRTFCKFDRAVRVQIRRTYIEINIVQIIRRLIQDIKRKRIRACGNIDTAKNKVSPFSVFTVGYTIAFQRN